MSCSARWNQHGLLDCRQHRRIKRITSASSEFDAITGLVVCNSGREHGPNLSPTSSQGSERTYYPLQVVAKRLVTITFSDSVNRKGVNTLKHGPV